MEQEQTNTSMEIRSAIFLARTLQRESYHVHSALGNFIIECGGLFKTYPMVKNSSLSMASEVQISF